ncbi:MAG: hypothetical protein HOY76_38605 [Streptomyces sp.]|nr:hypothetical protein [Streptomyces sp.]
MAVKPPKDLCLRKSKNLREDDHRREQSTDTQEASGRRWADRNGYTVRHVCVDLASGYKADAKRPRAALDVSDPADGTDPGRLGRWTPRNTAISFPRVRGTPLQVIKEGWRLVAYRNEAGERVSRRGAGG